eukprot:TRINITY_DN62386_c0_g1_i1.p1 TRINITY_DN62386_c0_g1~~TRINITY_DN62386_c0_g1_i1.p1  ORF type:complete len:356 (-),score=56.44 TRINITY_DN62386_c0_g1_i1:333-1400(-)
MEDQSGCDDGSGLGSQRSSACTVIGGLCVIQLMWTSWFVFAFFLVGLLSFLGATASIFIPVVIFITVTMFCCFVVANIDFKGQDCNVETGEGSVTIMKRVSLVLEDMTEPSAEKRASRRSSRNSSSSIGSSDEMSGASATKAISRLQIDGVEAKWQVAGPGEGDITIGIANSRVSSAWRDFDEERQNLFSAAMVSGINSVKYDYEGHVYEVEWNVTDRTGMLRVPQAAFERRIRLVHTIPVGLRNGASRELDQAAERRTTKWQVQMGSNDNWVDFEQAQQILFTSAKASGQDTVQFTLKGGHKYEVRFATLEQVNIQTGRPRPIREVAFTSDSFNEETPVDEALPSTGIEGIPPQ